MERKGNVEIAEKIKQLLLDGQYNGNDPFLSYTFLQVGGPNVFSGEYEYELGVDVQYEIPQDKLLDKDAILEIVNN